MTPPREGGDRIHFESGFGEISEPEPKSVICQSCGAVFDASDVADLVIFGCSMCGS